MRASFLAVSLLALSGCAVPIAAALNAQATPELMRTKTAAHFGTSPSNVRISNLKNVVLGSSYQARVGGTLYNCNFYYGAVTCGRPGDGPL